jgi:hypothetical protein
MKKLNGKMEKLKIDEISIHGEARKTNIRGHLHLFMFLDFQYKQLSLC